MEFGPQNYVVVQGYIDAKDDRGRVINCAFLSVASRREILYQVVLFGKEGISKEMNWREFMSLHGDITKTRERDPLMVHYEEELNKYLSNSMVLAAVAKNLNAKPAEQAVSRYCIEHLKLKAVCFVNFFKANDEELAFFRKLRQPLYEAVTQESDEKAEAQTSEDTPEVREKTEKEIFVRCDPVLDPIGGVAMNELAPGDFILGRLSADSVVYKLLAKNNRNFDGTISAQVSGIIVNELGTATVSLLFSDGVAGVMKLSGKVRVKMSAGLPKDAARESSAWTAYDPAAFPLEYLFAAIGIALAATAIFLLYYLFLF
ncbi:MAG: hypothetical protein LBT31_02460 [Synergistaceae bacterium]|nr:hypothetical protein [Synergistaceae bacterium]